MTPRLESRIFYLLLLLACLPVWLTTYFPSNDGPEHLHNAFVLLHLNSPGFDIFRHYYTLNPTLNPNWIGHLILAGLMTFTSPLVAEKIFLTAYLLLFPLSARYALSAVNRNAKYLSLLAIPLAYNWFFHMGFYNFCYSLAFFLLVLGYFFKHRTQFTWPRLIILGILLLALYFCHLSAVLMALAVISGLLLWQSLQEGIRPGGRLMMKGFLLPQLRLLVISLPVLILIVLFFLHNQAHEEISQALSFSQRLRYYAIFLCSFSRYEAIFSVALFGLLACAIIMSPRPDSFWRGLFFLILIAAGLGLLLPDNVGRGGFIYQRLVFFLFLLALLYAACKSQFPKTQNILWICSIVLALSCCAYYTLRYRALSDYLAEYTSIAPQLPDNSTLLPIAFQEHPKDPAGRDLSFATGPFRHAAGYLGTAHPIVDLDNYEAEVGYFPILWKPELNPFKLLHDLDVSAYPARTAGQAQINYVYLWLGGPGNPPPWAPAFQQKLQANFTLIATTAPRGYGQLWQRKTPATQP